MAFVVTISTFSFSLYWPWNAVRQLFHSHLRQPIEPSMPGNLESFLRCSSISDLFSSGSRSNWSLYRSTTWAANCFIHSFLVLLPILTNVSPASKHVPLASCRIAAVYFWYTFRRTFTVACSLVRKNGTCCSGLWHILKQLHAILSNGAQITNKNRLVLTKIVVKSSYNSFFAVAQSLCLLPYLGTTTLTPIVVAIDAVYKFKYFVKFLVTKHILVRFCARHVFLTVDEFGHIQHLVPRPVE